MDKVQLLEKKYIYVFLFCLSSFAMNIYAAQLSPLAGQIMDKYNISEVQYTSLYMCNFYPTLLLGIPSAWLVRKKGIKKCQCIGITIGLVGLILRLAFHNYYIFYFASSIIGFSNVIVATMGAATFSTVFKKEKIGVALGFLIAAGAIGKALAEITTSLIPSFQILSMIDIVILALILLAWMLLMDEVEYKETQISFLQTFRVIIKDKYVWICAATLMIVFGLYTGTSAHLPTIIKGKGFDAVSAGFITSFISFGYFTGAMMLPQAASKIKRKKHFMVLLAFVDGFFTLMTALVDNRLMLIMCIFIIGLCVGGLLPLTLAIPASVLQFDTRKNQVAGSLLSTFQILGAIVIPTYIIVPLVGNNINNFLIYSTIPLIIEGILFSLSPKNRN